MLNEEWITTQIAGARKSHLNVTEAVAIRIKELLSGLFVERQLRVCFLKKLKGSSRMTSETVEH
jgi:hypothetical protein